MYFHGVVLNCNRKDERLKIQADRKKQITKNIKQNYSSKLRATGETGQKVHKTL